MNHEVLCTWAAKPNAETSRYQFTESMVQDHVKLKQFHSFGRHCLPNTYAGINLVGSTLVSPGAVRKKEVAHCLNVGSLDKPLNSFLDEQMIGTYFWGGVNFLLFYLFHNVNC